VSGSLVRISDVTAEIVRERLRQTDQWGDEHDDTHTSADWFGLVHERVLQVPENRQDLVEAGALILAWIESIDRRTPRMAVCTACGSVFPSKPGGPMFEARPDRDTDLDWDGCSAGSGT
jgi:hypothetical protein